MEYTRRYRGLRLSPGNRSCSAKDIRSSNPVVSEAGEPEHVPGNTWAAWKSGALLSGYLDLSSRSGEL